MEYWQRFYDLQSIDDCQGRCLVVKLGAEVSDLSDTMRTALKEGTTRIVDRIEKMIVGGIEDGSLSIDGNPHATAGALYDSWLGASVTAKIHRSPETTGPCDDHHPPAPPPLKPTPPRPHLETGDSLNFD